MNNNNFAEHAVLVGLKLPHLRESELEDNLDELSELTGTAGADIICTVVQDRDKPDPAYFIGKGKAAEIARILDGDENGIVIFDDNLTPAQQRNLENVIHKKVIDRTNLILDIFASHARSREGQLQVELAQLQYMLPRFTRLWTHLSRLGGGIGTRGPGETQLEVDRRRARQRIAKIESEIVKVKNRREIQRKNRKGVPLPLVALVGYTNAGKSTLFNRLTSSSTLVEDKLFATLDPLIRRITLPNNQTIIVSDTVGFIRKLPHQLVAAFRATLEEVVEADILVHVIDMSHPNYAHQAQAVEDVLSDLNCAGKPVLLAYNKIDLIEQVPVNRLNREHTSVNVSALTGQGTDTLLELIRDALHQFTCMLTLDLPYSKPDLIHLAHSRGKILHKTFHENGIYLEVEIGKKISSKFRDYVIPSIPEH